MPSSASAAKLRVCKLNRASNSAHKNFLNLICILKISFSGEDFRAFCPHIGCLKRENRKPELVKSQPNIDRLRRQGKDRGRSSRQEHESTPHCRTCFSAC